MQEGIPPMDARIIGFGGPRKVDGAEMHSGRWARILAKNIADAHATGGLGAKLNELHLDGRDIDRTFAEWKDIRGASAPSIAGTLKELEGAGVKVVVNDYDINNYILGFDSETLEYKFDDALFKILDPTDFCYVSTSAVDRKTGRDGHYPFIDAFLQLVENYRDRSEKKPVLLVETPITLAYETTKSVFERAANLGVGVHENLIETLDPAKPITTQYIRQHNMKPRYIKIVRSDNQINMENTGGVNRAIINARVNPLLEKGIHEPIPILRMVEEIYGVGATLENIRVVHAEPFKTKEGKYLTYKDGLGRENYCAVDVVVKADAVVGNDRIPVEIIESFNRPANRFMDIGVYDPLIGKVFYSSLPVEQLPVALQEKFKGQNATGLGYFSQASDGSIKECIVSPKDIKANPLLEFIKSEVAEVYGRGKGLVSAVESSISAKYVGEMNASLQDYIRRLVEGDVLEHHTIYLFASREPGYTNPPELPIAVIGASE